MEYTMIDMYLPKYATTALKKYSHGVPDSCHIKTSGYLFEMTITYNVQRKSKDLSYRKKKCPSQLRRDRDRLKSYLTKNNVTGRATHLDNTGSYVGQIKATTNKKQPVVDVVCQTHIPEEVCLDSIPQTDYASPKHSSSGNSSDLLGKISELQSLVSVLNNVIHEKECKITHLNTNKGKILEKYEKEKEITNKLQAEIQGLNHRCRNYETTITDLKLRVDTLIFEREAIQEECKQDDLCLDRERVQPRHNSPSAPPCGSRAKHQQFERGRHFHRGPNGRKRHPRQF